MKGIGPISCWQIKVLSYGKITVPKSGLTPNLDPDLTIDFPYLGFLFQQGKRNLLVDTGISDSFIINGKAHHYCMAFSKQNILMDMQGKTHRIPPAPDVYGPFIPSSLIYNYYDYYDSSYKIKNVAILFKTLN